MIGNEKPSGSMLTCGEQLIDGQPVEIVSPQDWLQPIPCKWLWGRLLKGFLVYAKHFHFIMMVGRLIKEGLST